MTKGIAVLIAGLVALTALPGLAAEGPVTPLFADHAPLHLTLTAPIGKLAGNRGETARTAATLAVDGAATETLAVTLSPRGITRRARDICKFPPLRVRFDQPPGPGSVFAGQRRLKLVTHCRSDTDFQQHVLLEYAAYRLYNLLTPVSFNVRLATIDYQDAQGRPPLTRVGFFIEEHADVGRRNGLDAPRTGARVPVAALDALTAARAAAFNYMIGNLDFAFNAGPAGTECCHNGRLLKGAGPALLPVPYDFDFSGFVDAPYATPPAAIPLPNVRTRFYRGFCRFNVANRAAATELASRQTGLLGVLDAIPQLTHRTRAKAAAYLAGFFRIVSSPQSIEDNLIKKCI